MKTAISVPDETFELATKRARELGISRSEFFTRAAQRYIHELDGQTTEQINAALAQIHGSDESTEFAIALGRRTLADIDDEW